MKYTFFNIVQALGRYVFRQYLLLQYILVLQCRICCERKHNWKCGVMLLVGVIGHYYMQCAEHLGCCPSFLRTDCGTENTIIAALQASLRHDQRSHVYGTSPSNQRIEAWWAFLRRNSSQWWMDFFSTFVEGGTFHIGHHRETDCLRYCFMGIVRRHLSQVVQYWNSHRIRPSRGSRCPAGVPDILYCLPSPPAEDCGHPISPLNDRIRVLLTVPTVCDDSDFKPTWHTCVIFITGRPQPLWMKLHTIQAVAADHLILWQCRTHRIS